MLSVPWIAPGRVVDGVRRIDPGTGELAAADVHPLGDRVVRDAATGEIVLDPRG